MKKPRARSAETKRFQEAINLGELTDPWRLAIPCAPMSNKINQRCAASSSRIISELLKDELWLSRKNSGLGRVSKNEWITLAEIGSGFFQKIGNAREWHFGFNDYYDVYVWDPETSQHFASLYNIVYETLVKPHRFVSLQDLL
ncbi:hypothetical protein N7G274_010147 [Stereocaulon virgatum]|uniref:Uncharacterized protein n=1 Tax=Stereocaulon virgatum TaxID=373712 RepID=A0ABR3ZW56_9LECA